MKIFNKIFLVAAASVVLASCINDLNTLPLNETDKTSETAYVDEASYLKGLAYINGYYALVSQGDPGTSDISVSDAGQSELTRMYMVLNELSTDSFKMIWGDNYINPIQYHTWTSADNEAIIAVYTRCLKGVTLVNEFLLQTTDEKLASRGHSGFANKVAQYRDEARFHRAFFNYLLMDFYGNPPYATEECIGGENPKQIGREAFFQKIEEELLYLVSDESKLPDTQQYSRASKGAAWAVLSRMYLNAEVYTGEARWQDAKDAAAKVISLGYSLAQNYQELFMQDNGENGAADAEFIFGVSYDKDFTQSWGGTTTLVSASLSEAANNFIGGEYGVGKINPENWNGYHVADDYVARFHLNGITWNGVGFGYDRSTSDKRAFFVNSGTKDFDNTTTETGWQCWKFSGLCSDGSAISSDQISNYKFASIDFPFFRLAEIYLTYAEADARLNGGVVSDDTAVSYIKELRDRAGVGTPAKSELTLDWLLDERARELMWEGQRRVDLIRYGYFTSMQFPWTLKGGVMNGKVAIPEYRTIYPIIISDLNANSNLKQNPGY